MDVSRSIIQAPTEQPKVARSRDYLWLIGIVLLALVLRLHGIGNPLLDHPGWRQGDEAAIARNFAFADGNPLHPQADYNGLGPNYVELELQIVPWIAGMLYRMFGVHEIFGRLISIAAGLGTVGVMYLFGRRIFARGTAGLIAAFLCAAAPGAIYYGRTFQPEAMMVFFLTSALYVCFRTLTEELPGSWRGVALSTVLLLLAFLAKTVAVVALVPIIALMIGRYGTNAAVRRPQHAVIIFGALLPFLAYTQYEHAIAVWRWSSGITQLHVVPSFVHALLSPRALHEKLSLFFDAFTMLSHTILGPAIFGLALIGVFLPMQRRARIFLLAFLAADLLYAYAVVTVERVDYYLLPFLPLAVLLATGTIVTVGEAIRPKAMDRKALRVFGIGVALAALVFVMESRREIADYYKYSRHVLAVARILDRRLPANAVIVMGHEDPSVMYYIHRRGWEEDPYLWTPFDEQSAIAKGSRYFIDIEPARLAHNVELSAWLQTHFALLDLPPHVWPVYVTDPAHELPNADVRWQQFRSREKQHMLSAPQTTDNPPPAE